MSIYNYEAKMAIGGILNAFGSFLVLKFSDGHTDEGKYKKAFLLNKQ